MSPCDIFQHALTRRDQQLFLTVQTTAQFHQRYLACTQYPQRSGFISVGQDVNNHSTILQQRPNGARGYREPDGSRPLSLSSSGRPTFNTVGSHSPNMKQKYQRVDYSSSWQPHYTKRVAVHTSFPLLTDNTNPSYCTRFPLHAKTRHA